MSAKPILPSSFLTEAQKAINAILAQLEVDTDQMVESITIDNIDITRISDDRKVIGRSVRIELRPRPGTRWWT